MQKTRKTLSVNYSLKLKNFAYLILSAFCVFLTPKLHYKIFSKNPAPLILS